MTAIKNLIICNPYSVPSQHWKYDRSKLKFNLVQERRPAGFLIATPNSKTFDDPGEFKELELVNTIRKRVNAWRGKEYPNITGVTKQLLEFWKDGEARENQFFFCQIEAIETLIWLIETPDSEKLGIKIPSDGGLFERLCCKMATGTGKTIVMAMLIAWQTLNKINYPKDTRFSKNFLIMAPSLTVKTRLQALLPKNEDSIYKQFKIIPDSFYDDLFQGKFIIHNWHTLMTEENNPKSVVKLGTESNIIFSKRILRHDLRNIIVINDEAHHAYRSNINQKINKSNKEFDRDKRWIEGLDKIHNARNIINCFDFSATPYIPGKNVSEDILFKWIVSDFSLNDAIESGLTKTPRIVIKDNSGKMDKNLISRFYHLYNNDEVKSDLNRKARRDEKLPDLVSNAYFLLGQEWTETKKIWMKKESQRPPVMITICNETQTAARVAYSFENNIFGLDELSKSEYLLHIDSTTISKAEEESDDKAAQNLRVKVNTVGKIGKPGQKIQNIIAVQMLSEGWDAQNVTHIMGLRAFSSQLLCEQVVGRGLRRTTYEVDPKTKLFSPEYVSIFGVPFTFLPHEGEEGTLSGPSEPTTIIEPDPKKIEHKISWPNIERINYDYFSKLIVNWKKVKPLELHSSDIATSASMAQFIEGKPHVDKMSDIDLDKLNKNIRLQSIIFVVTKDVYNELLPSWKGNKEFLLIQIVKLVEKFIYSDKIKVMDVKNNHLRIKMTILYNMHKVVSHVYKIINDYNIERKQIQLNSIKPMKSTSDMEPWSTKRRTEHVKKSHINLAVYDLSWEVNAGRELERNKHVISWVKNEHIRFEIRYLYNGKIRNYIPDFLIKLKNNVTLVLEIKGRNSDQDKAKKEYLEQWVEAVNDNGTYGTWAQDIVYKPDKVKEIIDKHAKTTKSAKEYAKCPKCGKKAQSRQEIEKKFGHRNIDGITRPQSWCRDCRKIR